MIASGLPAIEVSDAGLAGAAGVDALMARLRSLAQQLNEATDWSRCDDHQVIDRLVAAQEGRWWRDVDGAKTHRLYRLAAVSAAAASSPPPAAPPPASSAARATAAAAAPPPPAAESTFASDLNVSAMVAALVQAAQDGVPFCEECARARKKKATA